MIRCLPPEPDKILVRQIRCNNCQRLIQYDQEELAKATYAMFVECPNCKKAVCDVYAKTVEILASDWQ